MGLSGALQAGEVNPYYSHAGITIYHGDCLEVLPTLKQVGHVITDPPYSRDLYLRFRTNGGGLKMRGKTGKELRVNSLALANEAIGAADDVAVPATAEFVRLALRWILIFHDSEFNVWRELLGKFHVRCGIWVKTNPMPQMSGDRPAQGYEALEIAHQEGRKRWNGGGKSAVFTHGALQGNWPERQANSHPCPKPLSLMLELVQLFTDPGEMIVDPFMGSGTTLRAAKDLGRKAIGIEINEKWCEVAAKRMAQEVLAL